MISDKLFGKFSTLEDLPVSEEMLGAYIEGNLDDYERHLVDNAIKNDLYIMNLAHEVVILDIDESINLDDPPIEFDEFLLYPIEDHQALEYHLDVGVSSEAFDSFDVFNIDESITDADSFDDNTDELLNN